MYNAQTCCLFRELRNSLVLSVMNLNENLIFMRMTSECNSSEVWKGAIVLYFEWILADMSFVMRWDTKQNEPVVSLILFVFVWMKVNCFSEYFWRFSVLLFHPLCAPDGYQLDKTIEMFCSNMTILDRLVLHVCSSSRCSSVIWALFLCMLFSHNDRILYKPPPLDMFQIAF